MASRKSTLERLRMTGLHDDGADTRRMKRPRRKSPAVSVVHTKPGFLRVIGRLIGRAFRQWI